MEALNLGKRAPPTARINDLRKRIAAIDGDISDAESRLETLQERRDDLDAELSQLKAEFHLFAPPVRDSVFVVDIAPAISSVLPQAQSYR